MLEAYRNLKKIDNTTAASMVYIYQRVLMGLLGYLTCLKQDGLSKE